MMNCLDDNERPSFRTKKTFHEGLVRAVLMGSELDTGPDVSGTFFFSFRVVVTDCLSVRGDSGVARGSSC